MTKKEYNIWQKEVHAVLLEIGGEKRIKYQGYICENGLKIPNRYEYIFQTTAGELTVSPGEVYKICHTDKKRLYYSCCVFGRFSNTDKMNAVKTQLRNAGMMNFYSGKWNHHFGPRDESEIPYVIMELAANIEEILIKK